MGPYRKNSAVRSVFVVWFKSDWTIIKQRGTRYGQRIDNVYERKRKYQGPKEMKKKNNKLYFLVDLLIQTSAGCFPLSYHHNHHRPRHYVPNLCFQGSTYPSSDCLLASILRMSGLA